MLVSQSALSVMELLGAQGRIQGGDRPLKTYESIFFHHDFVQFGKQHSRYKAMLLSIV